MRTEEESMEPRLVPKLRFPEFRGEEVWSQIIIATVAESESSRLALNKLSLQTQGYPVYGADSCVGFIDSYDQSDNYIAIVKDGSGVGRLFLKDGKSSVLGTLAYIKPKQDTFTDIAWLYYCLSSLNLDAYIKGSGIPHIYFSDFSKHGISIPSLSEQQKIADCLSSLDELITAQSRKVDLLKTHKKGLMQQLFPREGETVPRLRFAGFEESGDWELTTLGQLAKLVRGPFGGSLKKEIFVSSGYAVYEQQHAIYSDFSSFRYNITPEKYLELKRFAVAANDIIMSCSGTMGKFAIIPNASASGVINQALLKLTPNNRCDTKFLKEILELPSNQEKLLSQSAGGAIKNVVSVDQIKALTLRLPSVEEQRAVVGCLSDLDALTTEETQRLESLKIHKKGLMQGLFPSISGDFSS